jgi:radical SAM enzyme (TIGR01210 family)
LEPLQPHAAFLESELDHQGRVAQVGTVLLVNRECPWRCVMCDLWRHTTTDTVAAGVIPAQIDAAIAAWSAPLPQQIKLYNSGSFFDPRAIPRSDELAIARRLEPFERVIVECHPSLVSSRCARFRDRLHGTLEIAMGLETAQPEVLEKLNKRMTLQQFAAAAAVLREHAIDVRTFVLLQPPFVRPDQAVELAIASVAWALDHGALATAPSTRWPYRACSRRLRSANWSAPSKAPCSLAIRA